MKRILITAICLCLLAGCGAKETFETVDDTMVQPVMAPVGQIHFALPNEASTPTMDNGENGKIYLCDGYTVTVQTFQSGDLNSTLQQVTGFSKEALTLMETTEEGLSRYDCVWSTMGEGENQVCRCAILDDGNHHYVVTVMAPESLSGAYQEAWQNLLSSISLLDTD